VASGRPKGLPRTVKIGPFTYLILWEEPPVTQETDKIALGQTESWEQKIWISPELEGKEQAIRDTVLHEILHACLDTVGLGYAPQEFYVEERWVAALSPVLTDTLVRNPALRKFLFP
jgi:hypothetical protein